MEKRISLKNAVVEVVGIDGARVHADERQNQ
jgi:hypothetical protein